MFNKKIMNSLELANDLINIFTDYAFGLDKYFEKEENRKESPYLYHEYIILNENIKRVVKERGFTK